MLEISLNHTRRQRMVSREPLFFVGRPLFHTHTHYVIEKKRGKTRNEEILKSADQR